MYIYMCKRSAWCMLAWVGAPHRALPTAAVGCNSDVCCVACMFLCFCAFSAPCSNCVVHLARCQCDPQLGLHMLCGVRCAAALVVVHVWVGVAIDNRNRNR